MPEGAVVEQPTTGAPPAGAPPAGAPPAGPTLADLQKQLETLQASLNEKDAAIAHWYSKATQQQAAPKKEEKAEPEEDFLAELATKGPAAIEAYLKKKGYVSAEEAQKLIDSKADLIARENALLTEYPDLKDQKSDFFKATAAEFQTFKKRGYSDADAMERAAERVSLRNLREQKKKDEEEGERTTRAKGATGETSRGTRSRAAAADEGDDELNDEQKRICDAMGVPYDEYKKIAKKGVSLSARNGLGAMK